MALLVTPSTGSLLRLSSLAPAVRGAISLPRKLTLLEVFAQAPTPLTVGQLSTALGLHPDLLPRIVAGRQPMPVALAAKVADLLGVEVGTVTGSCLSLTEITSAVAYVPVPPVRELGDPLSFVQLARTRDPLTT